MWRQARPWQFCSGFSDQYLYNPFFSASWFIQKKNFSDCSLSSPTRTVWFFLYKMEFKMKTYDHPNILQLGELSQGSSATFYLKSQWFSPTNAFNGQLCVWIEEYLQAMMKSSSKDPGIFIAFANGTLVFLFRFEYTWTVTLFLAEAREPPSLYEYMLLLFMLSVIS
jgi:hypothetical protein